MSGAQEGVGPRKARRDQAFGSQEPAGGRGGGKQAVPSLRSGVTARQVEPALLPPCVGGGPTPLCCHGNDGPLVLGSTARRRMEVTMAFRGLETPARHSHGWHYGKDLSLHCKN